MKGVASVAIVSVESKIYSTKGSHQKVMSFPLTRREGGGGEETEESIFEFCPITIKSQNLGIKSLVSREELLKGTSLMKYSLG